MINKENWNTCFDDLIIGILFFICIQWNWYCHIRLDIVEWRRYVFHWINYYDFFFTGNLWSSKSHLRGAPTPSHQTFWHPFFVPRIFGLGILGLGGLEICWNGEHVCSDFFYAAPLVVLYGWLSTLPRLLYAFNQYFLYIGRIKAYIIH